MKLPPTLFTLAALLSASSHAAELDLAAAESHASNHGRTALEASSAAITVPDLKRYVNRLASTEYEGRGTGDRGERMATAYLASFFEGLELTPAGDEGSFFQSFSVTAGKELAGENHLRIELAEPLGLVRQLEPGSDLQPLSFSPSGEVPEAPVVFAGFGIQTEGYDSFADIDPKGKWLVLLRGAPKDKKEMQRLGALSAKAGVAKKLGAVGILFVKAGHPGAGPEIIPPTTNVGGGNDLLPAFTISDRLAATLLTGGRDPKALQDMFKAHYEGGEIRSFPLPYHVGARIALRPRALEGRNVIARLQVGDEPSAEAIVVGGHIDHLGYGNRGGTRARGDAATKLHLGADDNASGVAAIMELAQFFADQKKAGSLDLKRDLVFAAWSGEEMGLHGSRHFVEDASVGEGDEKTLYPSVSAYINLDMVGRLEDKPLKIQATGSSGAWGDLLDGIESELKTQRSPNPYLPTDSSPFYSAGVPVLALFTGLHADYHTPADTVDKIDFDGLAKVSDYLRSVSAAAAKLDEPPGYVKVERNRNRSKVVLGIRMQDAPDGEGAQVAQVVADSAAQKAGVEEGDVIVSLNDKEVKSMQSLQAVLSKLQPDKEIPMTVRRGDREEELKITPAKR